ncbi:siderophore-interacting protein [Asticcacaulis solisilvae]|uniref:siderophore-interacting protein n=1 Tax=Asticcacaulis solisilvae TaxID=1217274 RepID=UPI003FD7F416
MHGGTDIQGGNHLLIGDTAALPALMRKLDGLPAGARAIAVIKAEYDERPQVGTGADLSVHWADEYRGLNDVVRGLFLPQDQLNAWVACEATEARLICTQLVEDHGVDPSRLYTLIW